MSESSYRGIGSAAYPAWKVSWFAVALIFGCLFAAGISAQAGDRIISTDAGITDIVTALDAAEQLVGIDVTSSAPAGYEGLPRVGYHRSLATEGLLSLRPDLILASEHAGPEATLDALRGLGVEVLQLDMPLNARDLEQNVTQIAAALHRQERAQSLLAEFKAQQQRLTAKSLAEPTALLLRESNGVLRVAGELTAGAALLSLIGARNGADFNGYRSYSEEALMAVDPEVLLITLGSGQTLDSLFERYPLLAHLTAVRKGRVQAVSGSALVGGLSLATLHEAEALLDALGKEQVANR